MRKLSVFFNLQGYENDDDHYDVINYSIDENNTGNNGGDVEQDRGAQNIQNPYYGDGGSMIPDSSDNTDRTTELITAQTNIYYE